MAYKFRLLSMGRSALLMNRRSEMHYRIARNCLLITLAIFLIIFAVLLCSLAIFIYLVPCPVWQPPSNGNTTTATFTVFDDDGREISNGTTTSIANDTWIKRWYKWLLFTNVSSTNKNVTTIDDRLNSSSGQHNHHHHRHWLTIPLMKFDLYKWKCPNVQMVYLFHEEEDDDHDHDKENKDQPISTSTTVSTTVNKRGLLFKSIKTL